MALNQTSIERRFLLIAKKYFSPGDRVLVAASGGMDSTALLFLLHLWRTKLGIQLAIAHVHHGLRGRSSDKDAAFVQALGKKMGISVFTEFADVKKLAKEAKLSIEETARELRYARLLKIAGENNFVKIVTAHHRSDQAETVLMRLLMGTGWQGLSGIRKMRGPYVRPLLEFTRREIEAYVHEKNIHYVQDETNSDSRFLRNRIRKELMPLLVSAYNPQAESHLAHLAAIAEATHAWIENATDRPFHKVCTVSDGKIGLAIKTYKKYLLPIRFSIVGRIFEQQGAREGLSYKGFEQIDNLALVSPSRKRITFGNIECRKEYEYLIFTALHSVPVLQRPRVLKSYVDQVDKQFGKNPYIEFIDADAIHGSLKLRIWKPGDRFIPLGMNTEKKLSDFFTDKKIPPSQRTWILCDKKRIVWVCGHRIDHRYKIGARTKRIMRLEIR